MINTDQFYFEKDDQVLHQEASSLGWPALRAPHMFTLESSYTGRKVAMELKETHRAEDGDIIHWEYKSNLVPTTVIVFND